MKRKKDFFFPNISFNMNHYYILFLDVVDMDHNLVMNQNDIGIDLNELEYYMVMIHSFVEEDLEQDHVYLDVHV